MIRRFVAKLYSVFRSVRFIRNSREGSKRQAAGAGKDKPTNSSNNGSPRKFFENIMPSGCLNGSPKEHRLKDALRVFMSGSSSGQEIQPRDSREGSKRQAAGAGKDKPTNSSKEGSRRNFLEKQSGMFNESPKKDRLKDVLHVYTDASIDTDLKKTVAPSGIGAVVFTTVTSSNNRNRVQMQLSFNITNYGTGRNTDRAEIFAVTVILRYLLDKYRSREIIVKTDSEAVIRELETKDQQAGQLYKDAANLHDLGTHFTHGVTIMWIGNGEEQKNRQADFLARYAAGLRERLQKKEPRPKRGNKEFKIEHDANLTAESEIVYPYPDEPLIANLLQSDTFVTEIEAHRGPDITNIP
ncbi:unnamed protein product, partial [Mesorhabditis belari]|uniref:RNase H type-1 domain-containing protein n=1 Tax=Mesorhabditis belari TaxID=2138241 RepID=A0AAF3EXQ6_9BILA